MCYGTTAPHTPIPGMLTVPWHPTCCPPSPSAGRLLLRVRSSAVSFTPHAVSPRVVRCPQVDTEHALTNARALVLKLQTLELQVLHHTYSRPLDLAALRRVREELGYRADKLRAEVKEVRGTEPQGVG